MRILKLGCCFLLHNLRSVLAKFTIGLFDMITKITRRIFDKIVFWKLHPLKIRNFSWIICSLICKLKQKLLMVLLLSFFQPFNWKKPIHLLFFWSNQKCFIFNFTPLLCAKQNKQYYAHWLKNKPVESVIASRTYIIQSAEYATRVYRS